MATVLGIKIEDRSSKPRHRIWPNSSGSPCLVSIPGTLQPVSQLRAFGMLLPAPPPSPLSCRDCIHQLIPVPCHQCLASVNITVEYI